MAERVWRGEVDPTRVPENIRASLERLRRELRPARDAIDWIPVRGRRRQAEARIEVMERYARDRACRRMALIGYFGESLVRCAGCDVCSRRPPRALVSPEADHRLTRLRLALGHLEAPWGRCPLEPEVLRRLATNPPESEAELARIDGVGAVVARRFSRTILGALGVAARV
jgi:hypothetical protein